MVNQGDQPAGSSDPVLVDGAQLGALLTHVNALVVGIAADGTIRWASPAARSVLGYEPDEMVGRNVADFMHPDDVGLLADRWAGWIGRGGSSVEPAYRVRRADGGFTTLTVDAVTGPRVAPFGAAVVTLRPSEQTTDTERELRERLLNEERLVQLANTFMRLPLGHFDEGVRALLAQLGALRAIDRVTLWLRRGDELHQVGQWVADGVPSAIETPDPLPIGGSPFLRDLAAGHEVHLSDTDDLPPGVRGAAEIRAQGIRTLRAAPILRQGELAGFLSFSSRIAVSLREASYGAMLRSAAGLLGEALARHEAERRLAYEARADSVTALGNRWAFLDELAAALRRPDRDRQLAVLLLDLDRFKVVNDSLGHSAGDDLLAAVAARLSAVALPGEELARLGGDEIVVLSPAIAGEDQAISRARELTDALREPFSVGGHQVYVTASGGIALTGRGDLDPQELLRRADAAMYQAKERGRDRIVVFDESLKEEVSVRLQRESELRAAIEREQLVLHYQPEYDLASGRVLGVEALVRWQHPERGLLAAGEFIAMAEETGAILDLGHWVFRAACRQLAEWQRHGFRLTMRVNLSARQITQPDLVPKLIECFRESQIETGSLCFEITETAVMADVELSLEVLEKLHALGLELAIDDFGTGYSSLSHLKRFPVDVVKVDQGFVAGLGHDPDDAAIVEAIIKMAGALGLEVTAEGIETEPQLVALRALGCPRGQGFLLARPMPADRIALIEELQP